jgi:hypothetical protein
MGGWVSMTDLFFCMDVVFVFVVTHVYLAPCTVSDSTQILHEQSSGAIGAVLSFAGFAGHSLPCVGL